jgi:hypothetical protein
MLGWLVEKMRTAHAIRTLRRDPLIQLARTAIAAAWTAEVCKDFSPEFVQRQRGKMMEEAIRIAVAPDRRMANRERLVACVLEFAQFQVLVLPPEGEEIKSGELRGQPGITGELKGHLLELARKDKRLQEFMHGFGNFSTWDEVWDAVLIRYRMCWAWAHFHQSLRSAVNDVNRAPGKDWYRPFVAAMCAWEEHHFRRAIELPPALGKGKVDAELEALAYGTFLKSVTNGERYPDLDWRRFMESLETSNSDSSRWDRLLLVGDRL